MITLDEREIDGVSTPVLSQSGSDFGSKDTESERESGFARCGGVGADSMIGGVGKENHDPEPEREWAALECTRTMTDPSCG